MTGVRGLQVAGVEMWEAKVQGIEDIRHFFQVSWLYWAQ